MPRAHQHIVNGKCLRTCTLIALSIPLYCGGGASQAADRSLSHLIAADGVDGDSFTGGFGWSGPWTTSEISPAILLDRGLVWPAGSISLTDGRAVEMIGTGERNNPLRRQLAEPFAGDELFVRFLLRYRADGIDTAAVDDGEFFVLWLDDRDGGDQATHGEVPNIGIHVATEGPLKDSNVFMARISPQESGWSEIELSGDRTFLIVGRLSKSVTGEFENYDTVELWIDPRVDAMREPAATIHRRQSINQVRWLGFSTGRKTESGDRIWIDELAVGRTWESVLGLPPVETEETVDPSEPVVAVNFSDEVYPLLESRCFECHRGDDPDSGTRLDHLDAVLEFVVPGQSGQSPLMQRVESADSTEQMPPAEAGLPLTANEQALLRMWIDQGAVWDEELLPTPRLESDHWAFQPINRPPVPGAINTAWERTPVDAFILARQREAGVVPAAVADRTTLIRRLSFDLLGLPPTPEEVDAFVNDDAPDAYDRLVERLLVSPHHGERWGRHWLDLARFAESNGHQHNRNRPHAWRYRDYVVESFNSGAAYDQFLTEQIAGDELEAFSDAGLVATGFLAAARYSGNELNKQVQRNDILVDVVNTTAATVLGLTMECAQCHNHKFDPITARDYYRFQGFFLQGQPVNVILPGAAADVASQPVDSERGDLIREQEELYASVHERLFRAERRKRPDGEILLTPSRVVGGMTDEERARYDDLGVQIAALPQTWAYHSPVTAARSLSVPRLEMRWPLEFDASLLAELQPTLYVRGEIGNPGPVVGTGWPSVFGPVPEDAPIAERPRTVLAAWLKSPENPLTARVWVNRIWQYHFGRGLVETASNFGVETPLPRQAALLDWLAAELVDSGWNTRHVQKLVLLSGTYRLSAEHSTANADADPGNELYWKWIPRRLEAEAIHDTILTVSGELDRRMGGASDQSEESRRRSLYQFQRRNDLPHMQKLFDGPSTLTSCSRREVSTVPLQPLYLLNSAFVRDCAEHFADRVRSSAGDDTGAQIGTAFELALGRQPDAFERDQLNLFLDEATDGATASDGLVDLCQALLNLNEFLYIP